MFIYIYKYMNTHHSFLGLRYISQRAVLITIEATDRLRSGPGSIPKPQW